MLQGSALRSGLMLGQRSRSRLAKMAFGSCTEGQIVSYILRGGRVLSVVHRCPQVLPLAPLGASLRSVVGFHVAASLVTMSRAGWDRSPVPLFRALIPCLVEPRGQAAMLGQALVVFARCGLRARSTGFLLPPSGSSPSELYLGALRFRART